MPVWTVSTLPYNKEHDDHTIRPIVFISRTTIGSERRWTPLDLEAGSIVWSIKRLRGYLWSTNFQFVRTTRRSKASTRLQNTTREYSGGYNS